MSWERRGNNQYYYKKEREGSRVKSVYVGRGEMADMISAFESSAKELENLMGEKRSIEALESQKTESVLDRANDLVELFTQAELLVAGFHTHHRQWRRKRNVARH
jgi:hypothetical protein